MIRRVDFHVTNIAEVDADQIGALVDALWDAAEEILPGADVAATSGPDDGGAS